MSAGLFGLLDDIAALARIAAASVDDVGAAAGRASGKAAGVVVDDTAVTPRFLQGSAAERELPIVKKIAVGSLRNKLLIILPVALVLSEFLDWALPVLLILGGTYLAFEGVEKIWERFAGHHAADEQAARAEFTPEHEKRIVKDAIRTDLILSAEIMVIALKDVVGSSPGAGIWVRGAVLAVVAVLITALVYGVVALIVKMDDVGLYLAGRDSTLAARVGRTLVTGMPKLLAVISVVGVAAMLWVGGHILLTSSHELGWHPPYSFVHHLEHTVQETAPGVGGALGWLVNTLCSAILGLAVGAVVVALVHLLPFGGGGEGHDRTGDEQEPENRRSG